MSTHNPEVAHKTCCACGMVKPITEYYNAKGRCKPCKNAATTAKRKANPEAFAAACRRYYQRNSEAQRLRAAQKAKTQASYYAYKAAERRATVKAATPAWLSSADRAQIREMYSRAAAMQVPHEVDHIVPLTSDVVCGLHVPWNLRVVPQAENRSKKNKLLENV